MFYFTYDRSFSGVCGEVDLIVFRDIISASVCSGKSAVTTLRQYVEAANNQSPTTKDWDVQALCMVVAVSPATNYRCRSRHSMSATNSGLADWRRLRPAGESRSAPLPAAW